MLDEVIDLTLSGGVRWVYDKLEPGRLYARHVGRPVTVKVLKGRLDGGDDYVSGTLEGFTTEVITITGNDYKYSELGYIRVYRRVVDREFDNE